MQQGALGSMRARASEGVGGAVKPVLEGTLGQQGRGEEGGKQQQHLSKVYSNLLKVI